MNSSTMNDFDIIKCIKKYQVFSNGVCKNCAKVGFEQHRGECWHDAFSTML